MNMTAGAAWLNSFFAGFDAGLVNAIHGLHECAADWLQPIMEFISLLGKGGIFLIILSMVLLIYRPTRRFGTAMCLGLAIGAVVVNLWLKVVIARPRPYADPQSMFYPIWLDHGSHTESDFSFPSGHTNAAFAAMVPLFILGNKKTSWLALVFGILMGISRIYLVVHYPTDVIGGFITGTMAGIIGTLIALRIPDSSMWYGWDLRKQRRKGDHE